MFSLETLHKQLDDMHIPRNKVIHMHTSLRAVGKIEGGGEAFLDLLIKYFTEDNGLFTIPSHTWAYGGDPTVITLDFIEPRTCVGTLPDLAVRRKDVHRSLHPTHSMAVFGDNARAEDFIKGDGSYMTPASPLGCYGKLYDLDGYVMLCGVAHNRNTYIHCVEEMLGVENRLSDDLRKMTVRDKSGRVSEVYTKTHVANGIGDVSLRYVKYENAFRYHGAVIDGMLGNAKVQVISARRMKEIIELINIRSGKRELMLDYEPLDKALYV